jgi:hypothetical protein
MNKKILAMVLIGIALVSVVVISGCTQVQTQLVGKAIAELVFKDMPEVNLTESADLIPNVSPEEIRNLLAQLFG